MALRMENRVQEPDQDKDNEIKGEGVAFARLERELLMQVAPS